VQGWEVDGRAWSTGFYVNFESNRITRATAKWAVMGCTFTLSRSAGMLTQLRMQRQGDWAQPLLHKEQRK
jgi:prophage tail gpP-like protein